MAAVRNPGIGAKVLQYIDERKGELVYAETIARELGYDVRSVQSAFNNLKVKGFREAIEVIQQGRVYRFNPNAAHATKSGRDKPLYELIGTSKTGVMVLQDEAGEVLLVQQVQ